MRPRIAVIGGGISGLAAAHQVALRDPAIDVVLLEAGNRLGGVLETTSRDGFLMEAAADGFLTTPPTVVELAQTVGLETDLIPTQPKLRRSFVLHTGHLRPIPAGFQVMAPSRLGPMFLSRILSLRGKVRLVWEYFVRPRTGSEDESLAAFVRRRFGREPFERLAQPLVGSIYTADPERLSIEATMPRFRQMERQYGSLLRAALRQPRDRQSEEGSGARYGQFATLRHGMMSLVHALAKRLPAQSVQLASPVESVVPLEGDRWLLSIGGECPRSLKVDGLVVATPANRTAILLGDIDSTLAHELAQIEYASCAVASLGYRRDQVQHPLDGFGFVVPLVERRTILSCSFSSVKYDGRAPSGHVLLRVFIGGACQSGLLRLPGRQLLALAEQELSDLLHIRGEPVLRHVMRQHRTMPQYHVGHRDRVAAIRNRLARFSTLALAGSAYAGVGVPTCIQSGQEAANEILLRLEAQKCANQRACSAEGRATTENECGALPKSSLL
jgi:oxygen-dependent protoporphyrinogen oxidase